MLLEVLFSVNILVLYRTMWVQMHPDYLKLILFPSCCFQRDHISFSWDSIEGGIYMPQAHPGCKARSLPLHRTPTMSRGNIAEGWWEVESVRWERLVLEPARCKKSSDI